MGDFNIHTQPIHEAFYQEAIQLIKKYSGNMESSSASLEMLAVAANLVGKLLAHQDQRKYTPAALMDVVARNIELGNAHMIQESLGSPKGSA